MNLFVLTYAANTAILILEMFVSLRQTERRGCVLKLVCRVVFVGKTKKPSDWNFLLFSAFVAGKQTKFDQERITLSCTGPPKIYLFCIRDTIFTEYGTLYGIERCTTSSKVIEIRKKEQTKPTNKRKQAIKSKYRTNKKSLRFAKRSSATQLWSAEVSKYTVAMAMDVNNRQLKMNYVCFL